MTIHTLTCPECGNAQDIDLPSGQSANMQHRAMPGARAPVSHLIQVRPRVMPILTPERSKRPKDNTQREQPKDTIQPHTFPGQPDLNRGD